MIARIGKIKLNSVIFNLFIKSDTKFCQIWITGYIYRLPFKNYNVIILKDKKIPMIIFAIEININEWNIKLLNE